MRLKTNPADLKSMFLASLSGILLSMSFPKVGFSLFSWVALVPFFYAIKTVHGKKSVLIGLCFGIAHFLSLLYWVVYTLNVYGYIPILLCIPIVFLLTFYLSLYPAFFAWFLCRYCKKPAFLIILGPALWVCLEYIRAFAFTGFPWELLGYSQHNILSLIQIADITGVYGISFLIVLVNIMIFTMLLFFTKTDWQTMPIKTGTAISHGFMAIFLLGLVWFYGEFRIKETDKVIQTAPTTVVSVIQGNIDQSLKWSPSYQSETLLKYAHLTDLAKKDRPDLVVWPETAAPFYYGFDKSLTTLLQQNMSTSNTHFLIGFPSFERVMDNFKFYNTAYLLDPGGDILGAYNKVHLVPVGEYVPLQQYLPFIHKLTEQSGDFYAGTKGNTIVFNQSRIGVQICFEAIFPELSRAMVKNGANIIINITNDAWFGRSSAPFQHFSMIKFRAVENKRSVARAANTGISGFIDPCGRVLSSTNLYEDSYLTRRIPLCDTMTVYTRYGDVFAFLCFAFLLTAFISRRDDQSI